MSEEAKIPDTSSTRASSRKVNIGMPAFHIVLENFCKTNDGRRCWEANNCFLVHVHVRAITLPSESSAVASS